MDVCLVSLVRLFSLLSHIKLLVVRYCSSVSVLSPLSNTAAESVFAVLLLSRFCLSSCLFSLFSLLPLVSSPSLISSPSHLFSLSSLLPLVSSLLVLLISSFTGLTESPPRRSPATASSYSLLSCPYCIRKRLSECVHASMCESADGTVKRERETQREAEGSTERE